MTDLLWILPALVAVVLAWDGWRRYLAHRERLVNDSLQQMRRDHETFIGNMAKQMSDHKKGVRDELDEWQKAVKECVDAVNTLKRSSMAGLVKPRGRVQE